MDKPQQGAAKAKRPGGKAAGSMPKILRACVVEGGKVIEEKRLRQKNAVTIGTGAKNTFVISDPSLPRSHTLFDVKGGRYELVFTEAMRGKVTGAGAPLDFADLKAKGVAKKKGTTYHLPLSDKHRGKVVVGDATIIFQFVVPPPAPARPKLPAAARGSLLKSIDWAYAGIFGIVLLFEMPILMAFEFRWVDIPKQLSLDSVESRFADLIIPDYEAPEEEEEAPEEKGKASGAKQKAAKAKQAGPEDDEGKAKAKAVRSAKIRKSIAGKGILAILGTAGEGSSGGAVADVFGSGDGGFGDMDGAFDGISGVGLATAGSGSTTRGGGTGEAASIGGLATSGGGKVGLGGKAERRVRGNAQGGAPAVDGALDSAAIARVVRGRMRSIQDCYEKELKRDPSLAGKIEIEFTISEEGRVEDAAVVSNQMGSSAVGNCIVGRIRRWRFPTPDGGSVTVSYPFIFTASS